MGTTYSPQNSFGFNKCSWTILSACWGVAIRGSFTERVLDYFQVRTYAIHGDGWNDFIFRACSTKDYRLGGSEIFETWKGRLSGMLLSGMLYDHLVDENSLPHAGLVRFNNIFGLYHAFWLWLLFLTIICALRNSLLINLGIYAGLMYNFSDSVGPHFYPWDLPAILFFTLAVILYQRRHLFLMSAVICTGVFFKETVLLCALLPFFSSHWKWRTKILTFFYESTLVFLLGKKFLLSGLHLKTAVVHGRRHVSDRVVKRFFPG